jgi:hypothetical protein
MAKTKLRKLAKNYARQAKAFTKLGNQHDDAADLLPIDATATAADLQNIIAESEMAVRFFNSNDAASDQADQYNAAANAAGEAP